MRPNNHREKASSAFVWPQKAWNDLTLCFRDSNQIEKGENIESQLQGQT